MSSTLKKKSASRPWSMVVPSMSSTSASTSGDRPPCSGGGLSSSAAADSAYFQGALRPPPPDPPVTTLRASSAWALRASSAVRRQSEKFMAPLSALFACRTLSASSSRCRSTSLLSGRVSWDRGCQSSSSISFAPPSPPRASSRRASEWWGWFAGMFDRPRARPVPGCRGGPP